MNNQGIVSGLLVVLPLLAQIAMADDEASPKPDAARDALTQKTDDASSEKNLQEVFQASEKTYSLLKAGKIGMNYGIDYSYYRNSRIDIAISGSSSQITRFRIEEDAQNSFSNVIDLSYGVWDNLTFTTALPLVVKFDTQSQLETVGLGDISFGVRWQPVPLKRGLPSTTLFATLSTATGESPYKVDVSNALSTGKGYYSLSGGASMSKIADPIVLFASGSYSIGNNIGGLNQARGSSRNLTGVEPGDSLGFSMGLAYALNYDVSLTASFQQSYGFSTTFKFDDNTKVNTADQISASMNFSLGLRTSPKRIVNLSLGFGLTEDASDVSLGFSMPIDFLGASE
ncbi:MAG: transporter [Moraxellaceae bacterium]|nr:transporter [Moraxellaceae bacterium]